MNDLIDTDDFISTPTSTSRNDHVSILQNSSTIRSSRVGAARRGPPISSSASFLSKSVSASAPSDPPADIPFRHGESIIMTADGVQEQQVRWNQLLEQKQPPQPQKIKRPEDRILPSSMSSPAQSRNTSNSFIQLVPAPSADGTTTMTTEPQYYATLEHVQPISVCSALSTTFFGSGIGGDGTDGRTSFLSMPNHRPLDASSITSSNCPSSFNAETSMLTEPRSNIRNPSTYAGFQIDDYDNEDDEDIYDMKQNRNMNDTNTNRFSNSMVEEPHPVPKRTKPNTESDMENPAILPPPPPPSSLYDRNMVALDSENMIEKNHNNNGNKRCRLIVLIVILVWALICVVVVGAVCGPGNCSRPKTKNVSGVITNNTPDNEFIYTDDNTNSSGYGDDDDSDDDTFGIKSYLRSISLTNASLQGSGNNNDNYDILQQADEMAINWIVNEYATAASNTTTNSITILNISDPMSQQRVTQLFAIVTLFYSSNNINNENGMSWTNATNWLQSDVHECEWYGIICNDSVSSTTNISKIEADHSDTDLDNLLKRQLQAPSQPTINPTTAPIPSPTATPTSVPISQPPTFMPTAAPTAAPTTAPTTAPTMVPSVVPSLYPITVVIPSTVPSNMPSPLVRTPTMVPSATATSSPLILTSMPTETPSLSPLSSFRTITSISLPMNNISGPINPNLGLLTDLSVLVLSKNLLSGTIPTTLARCTSLENFRIYKNTISGTIPNEIVVSWSGSIRQFHVGSNMLTGTIPSAIGLWNGIRSFAIDENQFTGTIPETIQNWTNIRTVQLNSNNLTGSIPDEFCAFLNDDDESIIIDQFEINCTCCDYEIITTNAPESVLSTTNVPTVSPLPATSSPIAAFPVVVLTPTTATTNVPTNPSTFTNLQSYIVSVTSSFGGGGTNPNSPTLPAELDAIRWLEENNYNNTNLQLNPNDIGDQFRIRQWYALLTLYYSTNGSSWSKNWENKRGTNECLLTGVTCSMGQDTNGTEQLAIVFISLPSNALRGRLPIDLVLLSQLHTIELSGNELSGTIPDVFITSTPSMETFMVDNNRISGTLSTSLGTSWTNMLLFNVANNTIGGSIPESLSQWSDSTEIILSGNIFTGTIPSSICTKSFVTPIVFDEDLPPCNN